MSEEDFRTQSRSRIHELLLESARKAYPPIAHGDIDAKLDEAFSGADVSDADDAAEICSWLKTEVDLEVPAESLTGVSKDKARDLLWNAFDQKFRPEMKRMERSLLLNQLDTQWKNHLYTMDHLRQGIGLVGYAQVDPKTEYKRQGMKEFDSMWEGLQDKVTDMVFRMEDDESFGEAIWSIGATRHDSAGSTFQSMRAQQDQAIEGSQGEAKKVEPIRNRGDKVGRNDPCPCGSGKKYKNCCMRKAAG
jgi:preprotein translocase subunit SecA